MAARADAAEHVAPLARHLARIAARARVLVADADGRELFAREPDAPAIPASVIKLPLLMAVYAEAAAGRLSLDERLPPGEPVDGSGGRGSRTSRRLARRRGCSACSCGTTPAWSASTVRSSRSRS